MQHALFSSSYFKTGILTSNIIIISISQPIRFHFQYLLCFWLFPSEANSQQGLPAVKVWKPFKARNDHLWFCVSVLPAFLSLDSKWPFICSVSHNLFWRWRFFNILFDIYLAYDRDRTKEPDISIYLQLNYSTDSSRRVLCCQISKCEIFWNTSFSIILNRQYVALDRWFRRNDSNEIFKHDSTTGQQVC